MKQTENRWFYGAAALVILSAILYCSWPLGFWLNPLANKTGLASELGAFGQPYNWVFIWGDIVSGLLLIAGCALLWWRWRPVDWVRAMLILLGIYGLMGALDAALPESCLPSLQVCGPVLQDPMLILHGTFDFIGSIALFVTLLLAMLFIHKHNVKWRPWIVAIGVGGTIFALLSGAFYIWGGPSYWAQRYYLTLSCVWVASIPFVLRPVRQIELDD